MREQDQFEWYQLRTTDVAAAGEFYGAVLGLETRSSASGLTLLKEGAPVAEISILPERARLRGAPSHWVGYIGVADVEQAARRIAEHGAERLPVPPAAEGSALAILRHSHGALVGLRSPARPPARRAVLLHVAIVPDHAATFSLYSELFGWTPAAGPSFSADAGPSQSFAWDASGEAAGVVLSNAGSPHIHAQWLYHFSVPNLERALEGVRARGGVVADESRALPGGARIAVCEDAQGAAFALVEPGRLAIT
jgi:predicted enzyme related to lactoylglutathione lyase